MRYLATARKGLPFLAAVTALLTVVPPAAATTGGTTASGQLPALSTRPVEAAARTVTLITGDRVTVTPRTSGPAIVSVAGADGGRADARVTTRDGDVYVYPATAERHIAAGLLDESLFDVTRLVADGYDDSRSRGLPLILSYSSESLRRKDLSSLPDGATGARTLTSVNSTAVTENRVEAADFWADLTGQTTIKSGTAKSATAAPTPVLDGGVTKVWLDGKVSVDLADSVAQIGAPAEWDRGNTGGGVDVAVLDTGYDTGHPDLDGVVASARSFVPGEEIVDRNGHGTHVASTIAGNGAASGGVEKGVAPGVRLHVGKVLGNDGSGSASWIIQGMEWAARDAHARVISMSLGGDRPSDGTDPVSQAVNALSAETGTLFTIAAGNYGPDESTISFPGAADAALTVGAVDSSDAMASFSSRGPRFRDDALKPEITAPGVGILAARSQYATFGSGSYATLNGTSMATPHVAGAAALVAARHPDWTGQRIKDALISTAHPTLGAAADAGGNGRVDVAAAAAANLVATGVADAGIHSLGGKPGETVTRRIEWSNTGDEAVTLSLRTDAPEAPAGLFTVADDQVTVPAHGSAATTVTTALDCAPAGSRFTGHVTALADGRAATRTLLAVSTREEMHHLRVHVQGRDGEPRSAIVYVQRKGDPYPMGVGSDAEGDLDVVAPDGSYTVWAWSDVRGTHGASSLGKALMVETGVRIDGDDAAVTLDGTRLRRTEVITPRKSTAVEIRTDFSQSFDDGTPAITASDMVGSAYDSLWALPAAKPAGGDLLYTVRSRMEQPLLSLASGPQEFDDLWLQPWSARPTERTRTLPAVFAGQGTAEEYTAAGARGKVAVVRYTREDEDQVTAAEEAGVAMLVLVNDEDGRMFEAGSRTSVVTAGISRTEGELLIDRIQHSRSHSVPMRTVGHARTGYLYDLVHTWHGGIPQSPRYAPRQQELARIDVEFRNNPAHDVLENRFDVQPYTDFRVGSVRLSAAGARRTDWVTATPDATWVEEAAESGSTDQYSGRVGYPAGRTTDVTWFGPIEHPRLNETLEPPRRTGNFVSGQLTAFGDGGRGHAANAGPGITTQTGELYRGGTLLSRFEGPWLGIELPAATGRYRLVTATERIEGHPYSVATRTKWDFSSAAPRQGEEPLLPLVQLDYTLQTSADGAARRDAELTVTAAQLRGVPATGSRPDEVELSYDDGRTWQRAGLRDAGDGSVRVQLDAPRSATFLSLRVHASDSQGNAVEQTVIRAAGLR